MGRMAHSWGRKSHYPGHRCPAFLLINPRSGKGSPSSDEPATAAQALGVQTRVLPEGEDVAELARASTADVLGMAGGDGSLAPVVEVALERDGAFVCIPFGTRNHFARDLGLARDDPIGALRAFDTGSERRIDVGRADERLFPNNVSLGVCARPVHRREVHRRRRETFARVRACTPRAPIHPKASERGSLWTLRPGGSRRRSTSSPTCSRRRWSSASSRVPYACSCRLLRAADRTSG